MDKSDKTEDDSLDFRRSCGNQTDREDDSFDIRRSCGNQSSGEDDSLDIRRSSGMTQINNPDDSLDTRQAIGDQSGSDDDSLDIRRSSGINQTNNPDHSLDIRQAIGDQSGSDDDSLDIRRSSGINQTNNPDDSLDIRQAIGDQSGSDDDSLDIRRSSGINHINNPEDSLDIRQAIGDQSGSDDDSLDIRRSSGINQTNNPDHSLDIRQAIGDQSGSDDDSLDIRRSSEINHINNPEDSLDIRQAIGDQPGGKDDSLDIRQATENQTDGTDDSLDIRRSSGMTQINNPDDSLDIRRSSGNQSSGEDESLSIRQATENQTDGKDDSLDIRQATENQTDGKDDSLDIRRSSEMTQINNPDDSLDIRQASGDQSGGEDDSLDIRQASGNQSGDESNHYHGEVGGKVTPGKGLQSNIDQEDFGFVENSDIFAKNSDETHTAEEDGRRAHEYGTNNTFEISFEELKPYVCTMYKAVCTMYKVYKDITWCKSLPLLFLLIHVLSFQCSGLKSFQTDSTQLKRPLSGPSEYCVFAVAFRYLLNLPDPNLPGYESEHNQQDIRYFDGVDFRPDLEESVLDRQSLGAEVVEEKNEMDALELHIHNMNEDNRNRNFQNEDRFISTLRSSLVLREGSLPSSSHERDSNIQPCTDSYSAAADHDDEIYDHTYRRGSNIQMNQTPVGRTSLFVDGRPSALGTREREDGHGQRNSFTQLIRLSSSVSAVSPSRNSSRTEMRRRNARARTFKKRWPHSHLNATKMADAGLFYTGHGDITKCYSCEVSIYKWEKDDDPLVEHVRLSPHCVFIQRQLEDVHENHGAAEDDEESLVPGAYMNEEDWRPELSANATGSGPAEEGDISEDISERHTQHVDDNLQMLHIEFEGEQRPYLHGDQQRHGLNRLNCRETTLAVETSYNSGNNTSCTTSIAIGQQYQSYRYHLSPRTRVSNNRNDVSQHMRSGQVQELRRRDSGLLDEILERREARVVLSEGFARTEVARAVDAILRGDGMITVENIRQQLSSNCHH